MAFIEGDEFHRAHSGSKGGKASNNAGPIVDLALLSEAPVRAALTSQQRLATVSGIYGHGYRLLVLQAALYCVSDEGRLVVKTPLPSGSRFCCCCLFCFLCRSINPVGHLATNHSDTSVFLSWPSIRRCERMAISNAKRIMHNRERTHKLLVGSIGSTFSQNAAEVGGLPGPLRLSLSTPFRK